MCAPDWSPLQRCNRRLLALLAATVTLSLFGVYYSTYLSMRAGGVETNPISRFISHRFGIWWFFVAKVLEVGYVVAVCVYLDAGVDWRRVVARSPRVRSAMAQFPVAVACVYSVLGLYVTFTNTLVFMSEAAV